MLPYTTTDNVIKIVREELKNQPTPTPQPEPTPSHPLNDFNGLLNLLASIGENSLEKGTVDETFEFNYWNEDEVVMPVSSDQLLTNVFNMSIETNAETGDSFLQTKYFCAIDEGLPSYIVGSIRVIY